MGAITIFCVISGIFHVVLSFSPDVLHFTTLKDGYKFGYINLDEAVDDQQAVFAKHIRSTVVSNLTACSNHCIRQISPSKCYSFNLEEIGHDEYNCSLLNTDKYKSNLRPKANTKHYSIMTVCSKNPCPNPQWQQCIPIYESRSFECKCKNGLKTPNCNELDNVMKLPKNGTAIQISTAHGGAAERAVDGVYSHNWNSGSCSHTKEGQNVWWEFKFDFDVLITSVHIYNRMDALPQRADGAIISVARLNDCEEQECGNTGYNTADSKRIVNCTIPLYGRKVRIQAPRYVSFCEVDFFGKIITH